MWEKQLFNCFIVNFIGTQFLQFPKRIQPFVSETSFGNFLPKAKNVVSFTRINESPIRGELHDKKSTSYSVLGIQPRDEQVLYTFKSRRVERNRCRTVITQYSLNDFDERHYWPCLSESYMLF